MLQYYYQNIVIACVREYSVYNNLHKTEQNFLKNKSKMCNCILCELVSKKDLKNTTN